MKGVWNPDPEGEMPTPAFMAILAEFALVFTSYPTFENFVTLVKGWVLCTDRHTISRVIQAAAAQGKKHYSTYYRFFSQAVWESDAIGAVLVALLLRLIPGVVLTAIVDDTLARKSGPHIWGAGIHYDAVSSTYGGALGRTVTLSFGHCWVVLSLWVPLPWNSERGLALPVFWRLYRQKKRCPAEVYKKKTELAREILDKLLAVLPPSHSLLLDGDGEYACRTLVRNLPERVTFLGPVDMDAALYGPPPPRTKGAMGRPRRRGARLPSPKRLAADDSIPWAETQVRIYGRTVTLLVKTQACLWWTVTGARRLSLIVTRDPKGRIDDRAYFSTDPSHGIQDITTVFCRRWSQEVMNRDVKQQLGLEHPQNGWWRHSDGERMDTREPGPKAHPTRGEKAARRTAPLAFLAYTLVSIWYLEHGCPSADVDRARALAPWYLQKKEPSFADMLAAARRDLWAERLRRVPGLGRLPCKVTTRLCDWLAVA
jgi:SRSO17 transposase